MSQVDEGHKERVRSQLAAEIAAQRQGGEKLWGQINSNLSSGGAKIVEQGAGVLASANMRLRDKKQSVKDAEYNVTCLKGQTATLSADLALQREMPSKASKISSTFLKPPESKAASTLQIMAKTFAAPELIHSVLFDRVSQAKEKVACDIALSRIPDVNEPNTKGYKILYAACMHLFEHGIREILQKGSRTSDTFIFLVHEGKIDASKLLVKLTQQIITCHEIFSMLQTDNIITHLDLSNAGLMPDGIVFLSEALKSNQMVRALNLSNNNIAEIGSEGIASMLEANQCIREIDLSNCQIGYTGAKPLSLALESQNRILRKINLRGNNLGEEGAIIIADSMGPESFLFEVDLSNNNIGDVGAIFIASMLTGNISIGIINLTTNNISISGIEAFTEAIAENSTIVAIDFKDNEDLSEALELLAVPMTTNNNMLAIKGLDASANASVKCKDNLEALKAKISTLNEAAGQDFLASELLILFQQLGASSILGFLDPALVKSNLLKLKDLYNADLHSDEPYSTQLLAKIEDLTEI